MPRFSVDKPIDLRELLAAFKSQKASAKKRRIAWQFTFKQWCDWWGEDIYRRGRGPNDLQMQRKDDHGPYHPDNVHKGVPKENARTREVIKKNDADIFAAMRVGHELGAAFGRAAKRIEKSLAAGPAKKKRIRSSPFGNRRPACKPLTADQKEIKKMTEARASGSMFVGNFRRDKRL